MDHLVFVLHGIGDTCDVRFRNIVECGEYQCSVYVSFTSLSSPCGWVELLKTDDSFLFCISLCEQATILLKTAESFFFFVFSSSS